MKVKRLTGRIIENQIIADEPPATIAERIKNGELVIVSGCFEKKRLIEIRRAIHEFGKTAPEGNPPRSADTVNFHRIDDNHPQMIVKRVAHFYRFSYAHHERTEIFELIQPMNYFRNAIAGLEPHYSFYQDIDGKLSQPAVLHYPLGGGYMQMHSDPVVPQFVEMVLMLSQRGEDYDSGGLMIQGKNGWFDADAQVALGDLVLFRPDIPHKVVPIDADKPKDWTREKGRWIAFSPIANIYNDSENEKPLE